jgi:hypothetical protein
MHDNLMPGFSARPGGSDACNPAAKRDSAPGAPTVRQQQPPWRPAACACSCSLRVLVCYTQLFAPLDSAFCCRDSVFVHLGGRCSASGALAELRNRVSASSSATGSIGIAGAPVPWDATRRQNDGASESRRLFISAASASADATSQPNANIVSAAGIGARSPPYQQLRARATRQWPAEHSQGVSRFVRRGERHQQAGKPAWPTVKFATAAT